MAIVEVSGTDKRCFRAFQETSILSARWTQARETWSAYHLLFMLVRAEPQIGMNLENITCQFLYTVKVCVERQHTSRQTQDT